MGWRWRAALHAEGATRNEGHNQQVYRVENGKLRRVKPAQLKYRTCPRVRFLPVFFLLRVHKICFKIKISILVTLLKMCVSVCAYI